MTEHRHYHSHPGVGHDHEHDHDERPHHFAPTWGKVIEMPDTELVRQLRESIAKVRRDKAASNPDIQDEVRND